MRAHEVPSDQVGYTYAFSQSNEHLPLVVKGGRVFDASPTALRSAGCSGTCRARDPAVHLFRSTVWPRHGVCALQQPASETGGRGARRRHGRDRSRRPASTRRARRVAPRGGRHHRFDAGTLRPACRQHASRVNRLARARRCPCRHHSRLRYRRPPAGTRGPRERARTRHRSRRHRTHRRQPRRRPGRRRARAGSLGGAPEVSCTTAGYRCVPTPVAAARPPPPGAGDVRAPTPGGSRPRASTAAATRPAVRAAMTTPTTKQRMRKRRRRRARRYQRRDLAGTSFPARPAPRSQSRVHMSGMVARAQA